MKDTIGLIPQVFYDVIGRIVPGAAILGLGCALLVDGASMRAAVSAVTPLSGATITILLVAGLLTAYVVGLLLGAAGTLLEEGLQQPAFAEMEKAPPSGAISEKDIPFVYDYILLKNPSAGARLAKLRAESHMCGAFVVGFGALVVAYIGINLTARHMLVLAGLASSAVAAFVLQRHLRTRGWRLQINCWLILRGFEPPIDPAGDATINARLPVKAQPSVEPEHSPEDSASP